MKKIVSLLIVLAMLMAMAPAAFAATETGGFMLQNGVDHVWEAPATGTATLSGEPEVNILVMDASGNMLAMSTAPSFEVTAGESYTVKHFGDGYAWISWEIAVASAGDSGAASGTVDIESYSYGEFTAPQDGTVKLSLDVAANMDIVIGWDLYATIASGETIEVTAGTTYYVYPLNVTTNCVLTWEYEGAASNGGTVEIESYGYGEFTATEDGTVKLTLDVDATMDIVIGWDLYATIASGETIEVTAGTTYYVYPINVTTNCVLTWEYASGDGSGEQGGGTGAGSDVNNAIDVDGNSVVVPAGSTVWYCMSSYAYLFGTYEQMLNVSGAISDYSVSYGVANAETGEPNVQTADADGYVNVQLNDRAMQGKYYFAITNNTEYEETFYVTLSDVPTYVLTGETIELGDNTITLNTDAPTAIYQFETGDVYDGDGVLLVDGPDEGIYVVTLKDTEGNLIADGLLADWNNAGYPMDLTGDAKTNTLEWTCTSAGNTLLVGVSNVTAETYVLNVTLKEPLGEEIQTVYVYYENVHTPDDSFEMPAGEKIPVDITVAQTVVLGTDGYYHLNTADGPVLFVDMTAAQYANLYECYFPSDEGGLPADRLRGEYVDAEGVSHYYDFISAMRAYALALDADGFYPLTQDLAMYIQAYGANQGWFMKGLSPFDAINNTEFNADSAWLVSACYIEGVNSLAPAVADGWNLEGGKWVYYEDGAKVVNAWKLDSIGWCYLGADGYMVTNAWIMDSVGWCYVGADGYCVTNAWVRDSVGWCYLDGNGRMVTNKWVKDSVGWCYVGADGYCVTNAWMKDSIGWCYLDGNGRMVYNQWVKDSAGWCYVDEYGYMVSNYLLVDAYNEGIYYFDASGHMVSNCWIGGGNEWIYFGKDGKLVYSDWVYSGGKWYYMGDDSLMLYNTSKKIGSKTYYFNASGVCTNP